MKNEDVAKKANEFNKFAKTYQPTGEFGRRSKLEPFREGIKELMKKKLNAVAIREILLQNGYEVHVATLRSYMNNIKKENKSLTKKKDEEK